MYVEVAEKMMRALRQEESSALDALLALAPKTAESPSKEGLFAVDLPDGGMGSIRLVQGADTPRRMGRELVTAEYIDEDQVPVLITVNLDESGWLFELDFWKVNFKPLKRYPRPEEIHIAPPPASIGPKPTRT